MAKCKLDTSNPKFRILGDASDADLQAGLKELQDKLLNKDHNTSGWWNQPMRHYPDYQNKIWKWDFAPSGDSSSTRKGWRLFAYVPDPRAPEPVPAYAFLCYDKDEEPKGNPAKSLAGILKKFLEATVEIVVEENPFRDHIDGQGRTVSVCDRCWNVVTISDDLEEVEILKGVHQQNCPGHPPIDLVASHE